MSTVRTSTGRWCIWRTWSSRVGLCLQRWSSCNRRAEPNNSTINWRKSWNQQWAASRKSKFWQVKNQNKTGRKSLLTSIREHTGPWSPQILLPGELTSKTPILSSTTTSLTQCSLIFIGLAGLGGLKGMALLSLSLLIRISLLSGLLLTCWRFQGAPFLTGLLSYLRPTGNK